MKENALLVIPHQDDETNLAGNIIVLLRDSMIYMSYIVQWMLIQRRGV